MPKFEERTLNLISEKHVGDTMRLALMEEDPYDYPY